MPGLAASTGTLLVLALCIGICAARDQATAPVLKGAAAFGGFDAESMARNPPSPDWIGQHALGASWGPEQGRAGLLSYDPDGRNETTVATGLRNCSGLAIQPMTGRPWCAVNERDALGDNTPFDYATSMGEGTFYGWPGIISAGTRIRSTRENEKI